MNEGRCIEAKELGVKAIRRPYKMPTAGSGDAEKQETTANPLGYANWDGRDYVVKTKEGLEAATSPEAQKTEKKTDAAPEKEAESPKEGTDAAPKAAAAPKADAAAAPKADAAAAPKADAAAAPKADAAAAPKTDAAAAPKADATAAPKAEAAAASLAQTPDKTTSTTKPAKKLPTCDKFRTVNCQPVCTSTLTTGCTEARTPNVQDPLRFEGARTNSPGSP